MQLDKPLVRLHLHYGRKALAQPAPLLLAQLEALPAQLDWARCSSSGLQYPGIAAAIGFAVALTGDAVLQPGHAAVEFPAGALALG